MQITQMVTSFQVFSPKETVSNPLVLHLVFCQVVKDCLTKQTPRITREERSEMLQVLKIMSSIHSCMNRKLPFI